MLYQFLDEGCHFAGVQLGLVGLGIGNGNFVEDMDLAPQKSLQSWMLGLEIIKYPSYIYCIPYLRFAHWVWRLRTCSSKTNHVDML
jgi:hypothetical protein